MQFSGTNSQQQSLAMPNWHNSGCPNSSHENAFKNAAGEAFTQE